MLERKWLRLRYRLQQLAGRTPPRVAFLHIPKCGGTTIYRHFKDNIGGGRSGRIAHFDSAAFATFDDGAITRARHAQFVSGHYGWTALCAVGQDAIRFTVLREPLARLKSLYRYSRAKDGSDHPMFAELLEAAKQRSFGDFCLSPELQIQALIDNAMTRALADDYYPHQRWDREQTAAAAGDHLDALDFVLELSQLDAALPWLAALTGTHIAGGRRRFNETPATNVRLMSDAEFESDARLSRLIAEDRALYRRAFGLNCETAYARPARPAAGRQAAAVHARSAGDGGAA